MKWDLSEENYPQIEITENHVVGLAEWLNKIVELIPKYEGDWNVLIADLWPNEYKDRLIGHVQMSDVATGYDTGFRVCAYLSNGGIVGDIDVDAEIVKKWLEQSVKELNASVVLKNLSKGKPFEIRLVEEGYSKIDQAIEIKY